MSASDVNYAEYLEHFGLTTDPFFPGQDDFQFFDNFNLDPDQPMTTEQVKVYIQFVLNAAGSDNRIVIEKEAHEELYRLTQGRVNQINTLMDQTLRRAFADRTQLITSKHLSDRFTPSPPSRLAALEKPEKEQPEPAGKRLRVLVAAALLVGLSGTTWIIWKNKPEPKRHVTKKIHLPDSPSRPETLPSADVPEKDLDRYEPVAKFLAAYDLMVYEQAFSKSILSENYQGMTRQIFEETGKMLIYLTSVPEAVKQKYPILETLSLDPLQSNFLLFWQPEFLVPNYKEGIRGEAIRKLQIMLKKVGLYHGRASGVADNQLTRALIRFQRHHFLEQTGTPDPATLFLLTVLSRNS